MSDFLKQFKKVDILYYATGFTILISFLEVVHAVIHWDIPPDNRDLFIHLLGIIEGAFIGGLVGFFFVRSKTEGNDKDTPA